MRHQSESHRKLLNDISIQRITGVDTSGMISPKSFAMERSRSEMVSGREISGKNPYMDSDEQSNSGLLQVPQGPQFTKLMKKNHSIQRNLFTIQDRVNSNTSITHDEQVVEGEENLSGNQFDRKRGGGLLPSLRPQMQTETIDYASHPSELTKEDAYFERDESDELFQMTEEVNPMDILNKRKPSAQGSILSKYKPKYHVTSDQLSVQ